MTFTVIQSCQSGRSGSNPDIIVDLVIDGVRWFEINKVRSVGRQDGPTGSYYPGRLALASIATRGLWVLDCPRESSTCQWQIEEQTSWLIGGERRKLDCEIKVYLLCEAT